ESDCPSPRFGTHHARLGLLITPFHSRLTQLEQEAVHHTTGTACKYQPIRKNSKFRVSRSNLDSKLTAKCTDDESHPVGVNMNSLHHHRRRPMPSHQELHPRSQAELDRWLAERPCVLDSGATWIRGHP